MKTYHKLIKICSEGGKLKELLKLHLKIMTLRARVREGVRVFLNGQCKHYRDITFIGFYIFKILIFKLQYADGMSTLQCSSQNLISVR